MARLRRFVVPGCAHHVYQRGVRQKPLFHEDRDFLVYMRTLKEGCVKHGVSVRSYTLMTNHVHLIVVPKVEDSLSRALQVAHTGYSMYFNAKYRFTGHAWEGRPQMCAMEEAYMWNAIRYVERNPVRAGLVMRAEDYLWSSAAAHCGLRDDILLEEGFPPPGFVPNWSEWLQIPHSDEDRRCLRLHTFTGSPWGTPEFLVQLEEMTGWRLRPRKPGRPRKENRGQTPRLPFS